MSYDKDPVVEEVRKVREDIMKEYGYNPHSLGMLLMQRGNKSRQKQAKVKRTISHYEKQTAGEAISEDEAAFKDQSQTFMEIPNRLVPSVRKLLARHTA